MSYQQYEAYKNNSVNTASPGELTLMLYNGCLKFLKQAKKNINESDFEKKNVNIQKAQNIINELMVTLNQDTDIGKQMLPIYDYINYSLMQANVKNDISKLEEAYGLVEEFRDSWKEVLKQTRQQKYGDGARV
ncbi:flagellar export chaperone FliS [Paraliobacillus salinarum]|uniref:flagellar export chaperone FliS n=1 Tax=Paraliobacillus salinarum TaxID=1158996 RepID=UPI0015F61F5F|nr:flagellar export chaperone FliS [Paraliobacillus salinarum]